MKNESPTRLNNEKLRKIKICKKRARQRFEYREFCKAIPSILIFHVCQLDC